MPLCSPRLYTLKLQVIKGKPIVAYETFVSLGSAILQIAVTTVPRPGASPDHMKTLSSWGPLSST
jgi:hypothetical protein